MTASSARGLPADDAQFQEFLDAALAGSGTTPEAVFGGSSDDFWLWVNTEGYRRSSRVRELLPGLPSEEVQKHWTNRAGDDALSDGFNIYRAVSKLHQRHGRRDDGSGSVLDFGCGFGRVLRFFLRDMDHRRLNGTDHDPDLIEFCRESNRWCRFERNGAEPPTAFDDGQFSLIYAYSVFSHFSEAMHLTWLEELRRITRSGGVVVLSVRPRGFIEYCGRLRESGSDADASILSSMFPEADAELARYDAGEYCFSPYDRSNPAAWWGEACVSRGYVERVWSRSFQVREFDDAGPQLKQHLVVLRA